MALENGIVPEYSKSDLEDTSSALLSSSIKHRLAGLSRLEKALADGCRRSHVLLQPPKLSQLMIHDSSPRTCRLRHYPPPISDLPFLQ